MRELIYVSDQKLRQLVARSPARWKRGARVEVEINLPGLGGVKIRPGEKSVEAANLNRPNASLFPQLSRADRMRGTWWRPRSTWST